MFEIYLASLILGGGLLAFSLIFGHGDGADVHSATDLHLESGNSADIDHGLMSTTVDSHSPEIHHIDSADAVRFLSLRNAIFSLAFFGLTGVAMDLMSISGVLTLLSALAIGGFSWVLSFQFTKFLKGSEVSSDRNIYELKGRTAKVIIPIAKGKKGKISLESGGRIKHMIAELDPDETEIELKKGIEVLILDVINGTAKVTTRDF